MSRWKLFLNRVISPTITALIVGYLMFTVLLTPSHSQESFLATVIREEIAFGFSSYEDPEIVKHMLRAQKQQWRVIERTTLQLDNAGREINFLVLGVDKFRCLGLAGSLTLRFFNNQLSSIAFYADDFDSLIQRLSRRLAVDMNKTKRVKLTRHVEVENTQDEFGTPYVLWKFLPLNNQELSMLRKYYSRKRLNVTQFSDY